MGFFVRSAAMVIASHYDQVWSFSEGLAKVKSSESPDFIDRSGKKVFDGRFDETDSQFNQGFLSFHVGPYEKGKWGVLKSQGRIVINPQYDRVGRFSEGLAGLVDIKSTTCYRRRRIDSARK